MGQLLVLLVRLIMARFGTGMLKLKVGVVVVFWLEVWFVEDWFDD